MDKIMTLENCIKLLEKYCSDVESCTTMNNNVGNYVTNKRFIPVKFNRPTQPIRQVFVAASKNSDIVGGCPICRQNHPSESLLKCPVFCKASVKNKAEYAKKGNVCFKCLSRKHFSRTCPSSTSCSKCNGNHHILLHDYFKKVHPNNENNADCSVDSSENSDVDTLGASASVLTCHQTSPDVYLPTVVAEMMDSDGKPHKVRALLDSGSQVNLI